VPAPAKVVEAQADESSLTELTQLTFGQPVDAPRQLPAPLLGKAGLAYLLHSPKGCPRIAAIELDGSPLDIELPDMRGGEFAVDEMGWISSGPAPGAEDCGRGKGMRRLLASFDLATLGSKGKAIATEGFQGFPDLHPKQDQLVYVGVTADGDPELWLARRDGEGAKRLTYQRGLESRPRFSRDGERLFFSASRPQGQAEHTSWARFADDGSVPPLPSEIWEMPIEGGEARRLTHWGANSFAPVPVDGGLLFTSNAEDPRRENFDLYFLGTDADAPQRLTFTDGFDGLAEPLADGRVAFVSERSDGVAQIFVVRLTLPPPPRSAATRPE
jgi:hypothetical protein